jgi:uncharacterized protein YecE (DUF72 family)
MAELVIGTAGWSIPRAVAGEFPVEGSALERYASRFGGAEVNSSFYRSHRRSTWERWRDSVPADFRFSVKLAKSITHERKLVGCDDLVAAFCEEVATLGDKLAVVLVQLPPKLTYDEAVASRFFDLLASATPAHIACEPRNASWLEDGAEDLLRRHRVARVAADPAVDPRAARPGGWAGLDYHRLHGSPQIYRSSYGDGRLTAVAASMETGAGESWCIFDNTASGAAAADALQLTRLLAD